MPAGIGSGRAVVTVKDRRITLPLGFGIDRTRPRRGTVSKVGRRLRATHRGKTFRDQTIKLDGNEYHNCTFERCTLRYAAAGPGGLSHNDIRDCRWEFVGAALETIGFLTSLYHGLGPAGKLVVEDLFNDVRVGRLLPKDSPPPTPQA